MTKLIAAALTAIFLLLPSSTGAATKDQLEQEIRLRAEKLEAINRELQSTKVNLETVQTQKRTLEREVRSLQTSMRQIELSMQSDEITIQKLGLELETLSYDLQELDALINRKDQALLKVFREMQKSGDDNMLFVFLRNTSISDGLREMESLADLKRQLHKDIEEVYSIREKRENTLAQVSEKKNSTESHVKNLAYRKLIAEDQKETRQAVLAETQGKESIYQSKLNELENAQASLAEEIDKIEDRLRSEFNTNQLPTTRPIFTWPVVGTNRVTQHFGEVSSLYRGKPHNGLDIGAPVGTPVVAVDDGVIMASGNNGRYQYGIYVLVKHENNMATLYAHLSRSAVSSGATVKKGQTIGYVGSTGYSTGPHLHLGLYWAPSITMRTIPPASGLVPIGVVLNPEAYF